MRLHVTNGPSPSQFQPVNNVHKQRLYYRSGLHGVYATGVYGERIYGLELI
jgi:hypothetical protein